jgi:hypothetical protein
LSFFAGRFDVLDLEDAGTETAPSHHTKPSLPR